MLLNLFEIIHHVMPVRVWMHAIWLFPVHVAALVLEIVNLVELILCIELGWNLPVGVHHVEVNQIIINYILIFRDNTRVTAFWRLGRWAWVVARRAWAGGTRGALGGWRVALADIQRTAYTLWNFIDLI